MWELDYKESWVPKNWCIWTVVLEKTLEKSLGQQEDPTSQSWGKSILNIHWKDWCWSWNSNTLATWCKELTHWKRPWCWERLKAGGEGDNRGWDGWMASPTQWTWVWVNSGSWWWTGKPGMLQFMGSQRVGHDWTTELMTYFSLLLVVLGYTPVIAIVFTFVLKFRLFCGKVTIVLSKNYCNFNLTICLAFQGILAGKEKRITKRTSSFWMKSVALISCYSEM